MEAASGTLNTLNPLVSRTFVSLVRIVVFPAQGPPVIQMRCSLSCSSLDPPNGLIEFIARVGLAVVLLEREKNRLKGIRFYIK